MRPGGELVGREEEADLSWSFLRRPMWPSLVLGGHAGVGKTRLALELARRWRGEGWDVEWMSGATGRREVPFGAALRLLPEIPPPMAEPVAGRDAELIRAAVGEARRRPDRLLVVDDAHALDPLSALLVQHLVLDQRPVLLIVRSGEALSPALVTLWQGGHADRIDLQPLSRTESVELVTQLLGGQLDPGSGERLASASEGNPLLLVELVRDAVDAGDLRQVGEHWQWDGRVTQVRHLRDVIIDRLGGSDRSLRLVVAVLALAEPLSPGALDRLVPGVDLAHAEERGLIRIEVDRDRTEVRLAHPLLGEVVPDTGHDIDWPELRIRIADTIAATSARRAGDKIFEAELRFDAGDASRPELFIEVASELLVLGAAERALRLLDAVGDDESDPNVSFVRGGALVISGKHAEGADALERALSGLTSDADRVNAFLSLQNACRALGEPERLARNYRETRDRVTDRVWSAVLEGNWLQDLWMVGKTAEATRRAEALLASHDEPHVRLRLVSSVGVGRALAGRTEATLDLTTSMFPDALRLQYELPLAPAWVVHAHALGLLLAGRLEDAVSFVTMLEELDSANRRLDQPARAAWLALFSGRIHLAQGFAQTAAEELDRAAADLGEGDVGGLYRWARSLQAEALAVSGQLRPAREAVAVAEAARSEVLVYEGDALRARCWVRAASGELTRAIDDLLELADLQRLEGQRGLEIQTLHDALRLGARAEALPPLTAAVAEVDGSWSEAIALHASALRSGRGSELAAAGERFAAMGARLHAAEVMAEAARVFAEESLGPRSAAAARRRDTLLGECGPVRTPTLQDSPARAGLTRREREIVELAASGLTNREIAERLFISVRTAEGHLYRASTKLGVTNRAELAAALENA